MLNLKVSFEYPHELLRNLFIIVNKVEPICYFVAIARALEVMSDNYAWGRI